MDPQLKQRLVGAAVLVSLAVLVVPILLDGGYQQVNTPRRDMAPMPPDQFEEVVPPLPGEIQSELEAGLTAGPDELSATAAEAAAQVAADPALTPAPAAPADTAAVEAPTAEVIREPTPAPQPPAAKSSPTPVAQPSAEPAPPASPPPATPTAEQWTVQLGSFASRANAEGLLGRVKATGVQGFILPLTEAGKTSFRVRAGPVAGRAAADRLRQDLERTQAIRGMLVRHP
jgi:DedD protein